MGRATDETRPRAQPAAGPEPRAPGGRAGSLGAVAAAVGVSRTTASNAYNRPDQLSPELRDRILTAAKALGYPGPSPAARSLRQGRTDAVGLIFTERLDYAFRDAAAVRFLEGVAAACEDVGRSLLLVPAGPSAVNAGTVARAAVDGFVIYSMPRLETHTEAVLARREPAVVVDSPRDVAGVDFVGIDDRAAFASVTAHVLGLGHRRIGVVGVAAEADAPVPEPGEAAVIGGDVRSQRLAGALDAVVAAGLPPAAMVVADRPAHTRGDGAAAAAALLDAPDPVTAVVAGSDVLALGVLDELARRGLSAPADVTVTGFDDIGLAAEVGLTTVRQPTFEKGRLAVEMLFSSPVDGARRTVLPTELVVRVTSGPPPQER